MTERVKRILLTQAAPFLNRDEVVRHVFQARRGENPWVAAWSTIARFPRLLVATDDAIVVLSTRWFGKPESVVARLSRATRLGEPQFSAWGLVILPLLFHRWIRIDNERLWVAAGDVDEVRAIDAEGAGAA
jgi:hypothetical protein